jgi:hypothetical protein
MSGPGEDSPRGIHLVSIAVLIAVKLGGMSTAAHSIELPPVDLIEQRIESCIEEVQALRKLRTAALALTKANESRRLGTASARSGSNGRADNASPGR